ncbi:MAG: glutaminyl-peptide cyclotransferase, partial [Actinomycetota bacterium]
LLVGCGGGASGSLGTVDAAPTPTSATTATETTTADGGAGEEADGGATTADGEAGSEAAAPGGTTVATAPAPVPAPPLAGNYVPSVVGQFPHDATVFTQGLEFFDGALLESGGGWNESSLRLFDYETGSDRWRLDLAEDDLFAEGVTVVEGSALQLTWQSRTLLVTDLTTTAATPAPPERRLEHYAGEGWGLCFDGDRLVMSDGSDRLTFRDAVTFEATGSVEVTLNGRPVESINELECVGTQVVANVWQADTIIVIDPATGIVDATIDASDLVPAGQVGSRSEVLNGIAYHQERGTFWLTGKRWPVLYEVELIPA